MKFLDFIGGVLELYSNMYSAGAYPQPQPPYPHPQHPQPALAQAPYQPQHHQPRPTGGAYAQALGYNSPYYNAGTGVWRKPNQNEIVSEICLATFGIATGVKTNKIEGCLPYIRHVCKEGARFHVLPLIEYPVTLPREDIVVQYYIHADCGTLTYIAESLRPQ